MKIRIGVRVEKSQRNKLQEIANRKNITLSHLLRDGIYHVLDQEQDQNEKAA